MNQILYFVTLAGFISIPPVVLLVRFLRPRMMPWWAVALCLTVGSWLVLNCAVYFQFAYLGDLIRGQVDPPQELIDEWANDGGKRVVALFFGWLYGVVYSLPFLGAFGVAWCVRRYRLSAGWQ